VQQDTPAAPPAGFVDPVFSRVCNNIWKSVRARIGRRVVVACASCILADDQVTVREVEVLRAICDRLDCPMPPQLVGEVEGP
jgi:uncharacterized protein (UPF0276 family)